MESRKKKLVIIVFVFGLILLVSGITYAWFNYRKETANQQLIAGDIYLRLTEGDDEIELSNIFPETKEEARNRNDNYITFEVSGINTSNKTVYYEFILGYGETLSSPKSRYTDSDLRFDLVELDSNGDEISYLLDAVGYDSLENHRIYVDTIDPNTTSNITRYYKLRMWLDENVLISDSLPDASYTATDYPNRYATIKLTVAGDFTEKDYSKSLYSIMQKSAVIDNINSTYVNNSTPGINFGAVSSDTNGKGVYIRSGTENDAYPIMYYRGAVEDNNVKFANKCWKAVRTTDTGGVKLIYNGELSILTAPLAESDYTIVTNTGGFTFDSSDNTWTRTITGSDGSSSSPLEISFNVPAGDDYLMQISGVSSATGGASLTIYKGASSVNGIGGSGGRALSLLHSYGTLTTSDVIKMTYYGNGTSESPSIIKVKMIKPDETQGMGCDNSGSATQITLNRYGTDTNLFPFSTYASGPDNSPAYNGYMYGTVYPYSYQNWTTNAKFGSSFTWDGTNYKLVDATVTTPNATHHYSCNSTDAEATCTDLRYVYYVYNYSSGTIIYYVTLAGGDSIEKAIEKMQTNTNDSNAKTQIDTWYAANMSTVTSKLEDTIWCNDRSISSKAGWDPTGSVTGNFLYYSPYDRAYYTNVPSLSCTNKNDAFTVSNGNGNQKLQYPVALLTSDEMVLAGGIAGSSSSSFYLNNGNTYYWSLSPYDFRDDSMHYCHARGFDLSSSGYLNYSDVSASIGLRPSVSLKHGTLVASGTGTVSDPYVIE